MVRRSLASRSNVELINGLRTNFASHQHHVHVVSNQSTSDTEPAYTHWTAQDGDVLYIPSVKPTPLKEERASYDITVKLFFLPGIHASKRCQHTKEAIDCVLKELGVDSVDILIVSYPGIAFDADDDEDGDDVVSSDGDASANSEDLEGLEAQLKSWKVLEQLHQQGIIKQLGVAEFSADRLTKFLPEVNIRPTIDQINVKDCCVVPKDLILYAKEQDIKLWTHNDCTDILPAGTTRQILGPGEKHANILAARPDSAEGEPGLKGDIVPQWVVKYTAVVKDRGVVENKGYFASAELGSCIDHDDKPAA